MVILLQTREALSMFQHWTPSTEDLCTLPHKYVTTPGPWKPQNFYDGQPPLPTINDSTDYICTQEGLAQPTTEELESTLPIFNMNPNPIKHDPTYHPLITMSPAETPNEPFFMDTYQQENETETDTYDDTDTFYETTSKNDAKHRLGQAFHLLIDYTQYLWEPTVEFFWMPSMMMNF